MNHINLFNIYNKKLIKNKKILYFITSLSIFLAVIISLTVPQVAHQSRDYLDNKMIEINGGDLQIQLSRDYSNEKFFEEIEKIKNEGCQVTTAYRGRSYCIIGSNRIVTSAIISDYDIDDDEVIIGEALSKSSKLKEGDTINLSIKGGSVKEYKIKEVEHLAKGVSNDNEILGYAKVKYTSDMDVSNLSKNIYISGKDGQELCNRLKNIDSDNRYMPLEEKKRNVIDNEALEETSLGILSIATYIISILCIVSTISMIMFQRKKDIAILRMLSIKISDIKKSVMLEISIWFVPVIIISSILSYPLSILLLSYKGIKYTEGIAWAILFILKNLAFNILALFIISMISLQLISCMRPISILKNSSSDELRKKLKKVSLECIFVVPLIMVLYCIISNNMGSLIGLIGLTAFCIIFVIFTCIIFKIISSIVPLRFINLRYCFKSIKKNLFGFVVVLVSITITLWFILIGFYLEGSIKDNMTKSIKEALPYNYTVDTNNSEEFDSLLDATKSVKGYDKLYSINGNVTNMDKKTPYRNITIYEVNPDKYSAKFNICEGENLFEGDKEGAIISDEMHNNCKINVGDTLDVTTKNGNIKIMVKGIYKSCGINDIAVYKENKELGEEIEYLINAENTDFANGLSDLDIFNINDVGANLAASLMKFLKVFKILSVITIFSSLLFDINIMKMNSSLEEKDEAIIKSLGIGSKFIRKSNNIKAIIMMILTSALSVGMFNFIMSTVFKGMFHCSGSVGTIGIISMVIISLIICFAAFSKNTISSKVDLELLRND